jgi:FtsP/CotA-like multicopper oxidase with cupredoxin domain
VTLQNNTMDGVAPLTQDLIEPGGSYDYEFIAEESSVAMYHAHHHGHFQVINGLFAPLISGNPGDWIPRGETISGRNIPADVQVKDQIEMVLNDAGNIGLTLNGKSFPSTDAYKYKQGDWFIVNYYNEGFLPHPMHLHQLRQLVIAKDGIVLEQPLLDGHAQRCTW